MQYFWHVGYVFHNKVTHIIIYIPSYKTFAGMTFGQIELLKSFVKQGVVSELKLHMFQLNRIQNYFY